MSKSTGLYYHKVEVPHETVVVMAADEEGATEEFFKLFPYLEGSGIELKITEQGEVPFHHPDEEEYG